MVHKKWTIIIFFYITFLFSTPSCWSIGTIIGSTKNVLEMDGLVASNQACVYGYLRTCLVKEFE